MYMCSGGMPHMCVCVLDFYQGGGIALYSTSDQLTEHQEHHQAWS